MKSVEEQFISLVQEGKISTAIDLIKSKLTEMAGAAIVDKKYDVAETYGMKKTSKKVEEEDDSYDDEDEDEEMDEEYDVEGMR